MNMWHDPDAALGRHQQREEARRQRRDSRREELLAAARALIPDHGLAIPLGRIALHAGMSRHVAAELFNATTDLATVLVERAWQALIERLEATDIGTPSELMVRLIGAIGADAAAHRVHQALGCGASEWQRRALDEAEMLLARALGKRLDTLCPGAAAGDAVALGRRILVLARDIALAPDGRDPAEDAALMVAMVAPRAPLCGTRGQPRAPLPRDRGQPPLPGDAPPGAGAVIIDFPALEPDQPDQGQEPPGSIH